VKFYLVKDNAHLDLDIPTLNFIWDRLWRLNRSHRGKNATERAQIDGRKDIMEMLEYFADKPNIGRR